MEKKIRRLIAHEQLPDDYGTIVDRFFAPIAVRIATRRKTAGACLTVGICGPQGSGKSTLAIFLDALLSGQGLRAVRLSLDDLYLTRAERGELARSVHPLFITRGAPGTHDTGLGIRVLDGLASTAQGAPVSIPRFDKAVDDRKPEAEWEVFTGPADVILFEGWCVGARPQPREALRDPVNSLERESDPEGTWRKAVNDALAGPYQELFGRIGFLILIQPPDFSYVRDWRTTQERKLRESAGPAASRAMTDAEIGRFIMHFERISRAIMAEMPSRADLVVEIGADQRPRAVMERRIS